jgi:outer membrane protein OmpA-like peptidoglycan-associated protein
MQLKAYQFIGSALLGVAVFATGCTTLDPYTREERTSRAATGAAIGAGVGAVVGLISGSDAVERRQRALIGAGVGGLAGGAIGVYMDRQEAELREQLGNSGVSVTRIGDNITLNMDGNVTFDTNSAAIKGEFFEVLNSVALVVNRFDKTVIEVAGHTDSTGPRDFNMTLSQRRADSVAQYLAAQQVNRQRLLTIGLGPDYPVADNSSTQGRALNRRVEVTLVPLTQS